MSTITFYSGAGDGRVRASNATYATANAAATGDFSDYTSVVTKVQNAKVGGTYYINRCFFPFDTSAIGSGSTISSATFSIYVTAKADTDSDSISVVQTSQASNTALSTADFDAVGSTKGATDKTMASLTASAYADFTLNATGLGWISKTGYSLFGIRTANDIAASAGGSTADEDVDISTSEEASTTQDPKLVVVYTLPTKHLLLLGIGS